MALIGKAVSLLCGSQHADKTDMTVDDERVNCKTTAVLKRMLAPSPSKSPNTVAEIFRPLSSENAGPTYHCRALSRAFLELCGKHLVRMGVHGRDLRLVNNACFDPYNVIGTACAFVDLVFSRCSQKQRDTYFETMAGKFCITSVFTLVLKFCRSDPFVALCNDYGCRVCMSTLIYKMLFGELPSMHGKRPSKDSLWETEAFLLEKLGGRLFFLFQSCVASKVEEALDLALQNASDNNDKNERDVILKCRNLGVVYANSLHCVDEISEPVLVATLHAGAQNMFLARVVLLMATQSLVASGLQLPASLQMFHTSYDFATLVLSMRLLNYCRVHADCVPLLLESRRDMLCGVLFEEATAAKAIEMLVVRAQAIARSSSMSTEN